MPRGTPKHTIGTPKSKLMKDLTTTPKLTPSPKAGTPSAKAAESQNNYMFYGLIFLFILSLALIIYFMVFHDSN